LRQKDRATTLLFLPKMTPPSTHSFFTFVSSSSVEASSAGFVALHFIALLHILFGLIGTISTSLKPQPDTPSLWMQSSDRSAPYFLHVIILLREKYAIRL
jgi:hypothetical protein